MSQVMPLLLSGVFSALLFYCLARVGVRLYRHWRRLFHARVGDQMQEFFLFLDPAALWGATLLLSAGCTVLVQLLIRQLPLSIVVLVACLMLPRVFLSRWRRRRLARFDTQLPDFLLALSGSLRAGAGIQSALRQLVPDMPAPLGQEFALLLREQRMGVVFDHALDNLNHRIGTEGTSLVVSTLKVAGQSGGNVAGTLESIAQTLRDSQQMAGRIQALTAQGRLQAWIMVSLPLCLALALTGLQPEMMQPLWDSPQGWMTVGLIVVLETAGMILIRRIVAIDL